MKLKQITEARYSGNECPNCGYKGGGGPREVGEPKLDNFIISFNTPELNEEPYSADFTGPEIEPLVQFVTGRDDYPMVWFPKNKFDKELKETLANMRWNPKSIVGFFVDEDDLKRYNERIAIAFMHTNTQ